MYLRVQQHTTYLFTKEETVMTYFERVDELRNNTTFASETPRLDYLAAEIVLVDLFGEYIKNAEIVSKTYGTGKIVSTSGDTLDQMCMEVAFATGTKKFGVLPVVTGKVFFNKFADITEIGDAWDHAFDLHTDMTRKLQVIENTARQVAKEAAEKAEAEKKAEAKYKQQKEKALRDFDKLVARTNAELSDIDEFYYTLGYIAKHVGTISAAMPDYLEDAFKKHFGSDAPCRVVDSKKKGPAGYTSQWTWSMGISLKNPETIPAFLQNKLNPAGKSITDTSFVWDLVDNYGFQFGKKQDIDKIKQTIPNKFMPSFEAGMTV